MIVVFAGPTLAPGDLQATDGLELRPPVAQGDVYRAAREEPWGIGIIDGYFEHVPAVWHKEILWAMTQGVHVFGAASMGALRAAELADFGMVGVGRIYEAYRNGTLDADDEVAVAHASAEDGFRRSSEAMVDIRYTVEHAQRAGVLRGTQGGTILEEAKRLFYADRIWPAILSRCRARADPRSFDELEAWLPGGRVEQKRLDGLALIETMRRARQEHPGPLRVDFHFEHTDVWDNALHRMGREASFDASFGSEVSSLLDELRLRGDIGSYRQAVAGALLRGLSSRISKRFGLEVDTELLTRTATVFMQERALHSGPATQRWLAEQEMDAADFARMMSGEARLRWVEAVSEPDIRRHLVDELRAMGLYAPLMATVRSKRAVARGRRVEGLELRDVALSTADELWSWYFEERLGTVVPNDLPTHALRLGMKGASELFELVLREYLLTRDLAIEET